MSERQSRFGFGLERLGLAVLRFPRIAGALFVLSLLVCASAIPSVRFDGNILHVLSSRSEIFRSFEKVKSEFRDFSGDLGVIVRSGTLYSPEEFEKLRNFHLDLTLVEGVDGVFSLFSASRYDPGSDELRAVIPEEVAPDSDIAALVERAGRDNPLVSLVARPDEGAALILIESYDSGQEQATSREDQTRALMREIRAAAPPEFRIDFAGLPLMRADAVAALVSDQTLLSVMGLVMSALIAFLTFRSIPQAALCTVPAVTTIVWVLGGFGLTGTNITYLSTVLPTIAMVLALADTIMLFFNWLDRRAEGMLGRAAIEAAIRRVGPATAMTSITTAIAFGSFGFSGNSALRTLAVLGSTAVMVAFLAVMVAVPLLLHMFGERLASRPRQSAFAPAGPLVARISAWHPRAISIAAVASAFLLSAGHFLGEEAHRSADHVPETSEAAIGERLAESIFGGIAPIYLMLPVQPGSDWLAEPALEELGRAETIFASTVGAGRVFSLAEVVSGGMASADLREAFADAPENIRGRFVSSDRDEYILTASLPYGIEPQAAVAIARDVVGKLDDAGIEGATVTGYPLLTAVEIPSLVLILKNSLIVAILLGIVVLMIGSGAPAASLAALVPNLLPIFFVETALWLLDRPMDIPHVIALTLAFGIAIDNAIHVINVYLLNRRRGLPPETAMREGVGEVAPALISATVMFVAGSIGTLLSSLPSVVNLGFLIIATLSVALIANLAILPALILTLERTTSRLIPTRRKGST